MSSRVGLLARLLGHLGGVDLLLDLLDVGALFAFAELLLDRLDLLVQVVLALALLHLALDAAADALFDLQDVDLALELLEQVLERACRRRTGRAPPACCSSLSGRCAAMVSARRPASSMPAIEVRISGGIFLLSLTYWSNCCVTARRSASTSVLASSASGGSTGVTFGDEVRSPSSMRLTRRALLAFDQHLHGAVGQLQHLQDGGDAADLEHVVGRGSSLPAAFWATSMIWRPASIAASSALMRLRAADEQRDHHVGEHHHVAQRQQRQVIWSAGRTGCPDMGILSCSGQDGARAHDCK